MPEHSVWYANGTWMDVSAGSPLAQPAFNPASSSSKRKFQVPSSERQSPRMQCGVGCWRRGSSASFFVASAAVAGAEDAGVKPVSDDDGRACSGFAAEGTWGSVRGRRRVDPAWTDGDFIWPPGAFPGPGPTESCGVAGC